MFTNKTLGVIVDYKHDEKVEKRFESSMVYTVSKTHNNINEAACYANLMVFVIIIILNNHHYL